MSETPNPASANLTSLSPQRQLAESVQAMLKSEEIRQTGLTDHEQGQIIVDRFIGEIVGMGSVTNSQGESHTATEVLGNIDMVANSALKGQVKFDRGVMTLTRTEGLRQAVNLLASDIRTGEFLGGLSARVVTREGKLALKSVNQLDGYLSTKSAPNAADNATGWRRLITEEVQVYAEDPSIAGRWDTSNLLSSDIALVRESQQDWERAMQIADSAEVDTDMVQRSAEEMRSLATRGQYIGNVSITHATGQNYDALFR